jgi:hypothetical protein
MDWSPPPCLASVEAGGGVLQDLEAIRVGRGEQEGSFDCGHQRGLRVVRGELVEVVST